MFRLFVVFIFLTLFGLAGCSSSPVLHQRVIANANTSILPTRLIVIPPEITISHLTVSGDVVDDPDRSHRATNLLYQVITSSEQAKSHPMLLPLPTLSHQHMATLNEHRALYSEVAGTALTYSRLWESKKAQFDYTIGPGLNFLTDLTSAEAAIFIHGFDVNSTHGRQALFVAGSIIGITPGLGTSNTLVSIVDLKSGDLLWMTQINPGDFEDQEDNQQLLQDIMNRYNQSMRVN